MRLGHDVVCMRACARERGRVGRVGARTRVAADTADSIFVCLVSASEWGKPPLETARIKRRRVSLGDEPFVAQFGHP